MNDDAQFNRMNLGIDIGMSIHLQWSLSTQDFGVVIEGKHVMFGNEQLLQYNNLIKFIFAVLVLAHNR